MAAITPAGTVEAAVSSGSSADSPPKARSGDAALRAGGGQGVERLLPRPPPAEEPHEDGVDSVQARGGVEGGRRSGPDGREAVGQHLDRRPEGEDLGVGGREEEDHAHSGVGTGRGGIGVGSGAPAAMSRSMAAMSRWDSTRSASRSNWAARAAANETPEAA